MSEATNEAIKYIAKILDILKEYESQDFPHMIEISNLAKSAIDKLANC